MYFRNINYIIYCKSNYWKWKSRRLSKLNTDEGKWCVGDGHWPLLCSKLF
jgi:hypothetical protein